MERTMSRITLAATVVAAAMFGAATATAQSSAVRSTSVSSTSKPFDAEDLTTGLSLGVYTMAAGGVSITGRSVDGTFHTNLGEGAGVTIGYGLNRIFSAYASLDVAKQPVAQDVDYSGTFGLAHFEVGARVNVPVGSPKAVPYVSASVGGRALAARATDEFTGDPVLMSFSGQVYVVGGGIQYFVSPRLAFDAGAELGMGSFNRYKDDAGDHTIHVNSSTSTRVRFGLNWHP